MALSKVEVMRNAITIVVEALAKNRVRVFQRGLDAKVVYDSRGVPIEVHVPYLPDDASEDLCDAVQGFIDHEIGHVLDTQYGALNKASSMGKVIRKLHNIVEDVFVESRQEKRFRGSGYNLNKTREFFLKKIVIPGLGDPNNRKALLINCACRAWGGQEIMQRFMEDKWALLEGVAEAVPDDFKKEMQNIRDSEHALDLAIRLKSYLTSPPDDSGDDPDKDGEGGSGGSDSDSKRDDKSKSKRGSSEKRGGDPDDEGDDPDGSGPDGEGDDSDDEDDGDSEGEDEGEGSPDGGDSEGEGEGEGESDGSGEDGDPSDDSDAASGGKEAEDGAPSGGESAAGSGAPPMSDKDLEDMPDFDDSVASSIKDDFVGSVKPGKYMVFSREFDVIKPAARMRSESYDEEAVELEESVGDMVGAMQKGLERALASRSRSFWDGGRRSGVINGAALSRTAVGDDRVFRKRIDAIKQEVAVTLLIDASGSMSCGSRIKGAVQAAFAFAMTLERLGVPCEVLAFTARERFPATSGFSAADAELRRRTGTGYGRSLTIEMPILKSFGERMTPSIKQNFPWLYSGYQLWENPDGECVLYAGERLAARRERRKVLITLSDGVPMCPGEGALLAPHLKGVIARLGTAGIECVGIGIQTDAVKNFYPKSIVLKNVSDLPGTVMRELQQILLK